MEDRELLEAAAKAAGMSHLWVAELDSTSPDWNPLTDDGHALRLAVKLRLVVDVGTHAAHVFYEGPGAVEAHGADPNAATRRAIVRAAAEVGKAQAA